jgi:hypothetical protein
VHIETIPVPAQVELPDDRRALTPQDVTLRYVPFGNQRIRITANGYRAIETDLRDDEIRSWRYIGTGLRGARQYGDRERGGGARGDLRYVLVPVHGPAGTWTDEDVPD